MQGVGYRPFVYALANEAGCTGWVLNDGEGVLIEIQGPNAPLLLARLASTAPPLARIDYVGHALIPIISGETRFIIRDSSGGPVRTSIPPDAAVCPDCLAELFDHTDRRYRYPFLNCTNCGPRFTITRRLPYDRPQTSMAGFPLCPDCAREYADPIDRRFHAQPIACPVCGPRLSHPIEIILKAIKAGHIVALKGLGGYHLVCDARNQDAVGTLRKRKERDGKPFAVMVANLASARLLAEVGVEEARALTSTQRPIVLCRGASSPSALPGQGSPTPGPIARAIGPDLAWIGIMLPYTPLHYLLFHEAAGRPNGTAWLMETQALALVMTSANPGGEPLVIRNDDAIERLAGIADLVVDHNRDILIRTDDSVVRMIAGAPAFIRRARGWVPLAVPLPQEAPPILAVGAHLKATICLSRGRDAFLSQHIGDLDNAATVAFLEEAANHLQSILAVSPVAVAHDRHPDFQSTRFAESLGLPLIPVQHHHAHIAAVAAEHRLTGRVLGLALDGFGLGDRGESWGGEMLLCDETGFRRLGHLRPLRQPGGDRAAREPWRMAAAALFALGHADEIRLRFGAHPQASGIVQMLERGLNAPLTSSCGRWFDAACALLGVRPLAGYEGEAPMALESLVRQPRILAGHWVIRGGVLDLLPLLDALRHVNAVEGAELFHGTLIAALIDWACPVLKTHGLDQILLGGGCLMNRVLAEGLVDGFAHAGVAALLPRRVPANDGGLALGQAWVAAQQWERRLS